MAELTAVTTFAMPSSQGGAWMRAQLRVANAARIRAEDAARSGLGMT